MLELNEVQLFKGDPENIWGEQIKQPENILSMEVTEVMNGNLTLSMVCAISDYNIENLVIGNIIKCYKDVLKNTKFSFEIYDVKYTIDHKITVKAEHLSSRLRYIYVEPVGYIDFDEIAEILSGYSSAKYKLINHTGESIVKIKVPNTTYDYGVVSDSIKSIADHMKGTTGSILDHFGGGYWRYNEDTEMEFYKENQVNDEDPELEPIKYSVNMSDFQREIDMDNAKSNQVLFWKKEVDGVEEQVWAYKRKFVDAYPMQAAQLCDLSSQFEKKPTEEQLIAAAPTLSTSPEVTTSCSIANYEGKATCGRKISVIFPEFGMNEEMRITETTYNVLTRKYKSIKLGTSKKTLSKTIAEIAGKTGTNVY